MTGNISRRHLIASAAAGAAMAGLPQLHAADAPAGQVTRDIFGKLPDGTEVERYTLAVGGLTARIMTLGATLTTFEAPGRDGKPAIVTLYLDTLEDYLKGHPLFGSVVGRYANRIANARFTIDGKEYPLVANARPHHIHGGGKEAFHNVLWKAQPLLDKDAVGVRLSYTSPDGSAGFPGTLEATVTYTLTGDSLVLEYTARTDKPTHVNLTNHAYWNLAGAGSGDALGHVLELNADRYLVADAAKIPTGEIRDVTNTVMDFRKPTAIGARIQQVEGQNYDHCYVINRKEGEKLAFAARLVDPKSGRIMEVFTTQPGVQLYTARHLGPQLKAGGKSYGPWHAACLETQHYPDSPNRPEFPSTLLRPGEIFRQVTVHKFSAA